MRNIKWLTTNIKGYSRFMAVDEATNEPRSDLNLNNSINFAQHHSLLQRRRGHLARRFTLAALNAIRMPVGQRFKSTIIAPI